jgi:Flp pilus assembly protein TadG
MDHKKVFQRGAAFVELALVLPILFGTLYALYSCGVGLHFSNILTQDSFNGGVLASLSPVSSLESQRVANTLDRYLSPKYNALSKLNQYTIVGPRDDTDTSNNFLSRPLRQIEITSQYKVLNTTLTFVNRYKFAGLFPEERILRDVYFEGSEDDGSSGTWECNGDRALNDPDNC